MAQDAQHAPILNIGMIDFEHALPVNSIRPIIRPVSNASALMNSSLPDITVFIATSQNTLIWIAESA